ncbi:eukaryotic porin-domain-containing protein [Lipomyces japonicus]|uniref:eukaryotic porin-domain-containing protein n=1 Tax=Lipomyces japonicus TaxID=56871 RepID=UPI0034CFDFA3
MATSADVREELLTKEIINAELPASFGSKIASAPGVSHFISFFNSAAEVRSKRGLTRPVKYDEFSSEAEREVLPTLYLFQGLRADINKSANVKPLFNIVQTFIVGGNRDSPYNLGAIWGTDSTFVRASLDSNFEATAHVAHRLSSNIIGRLQSHISDQGANAIFETDINGSDYNLTLRSRNPSFLDTKFVGSLEFAFAQSITQKLSLGLLGQWERSRGAEPAQANVSLSSRYVTPTWIGSGQVQPASGLVSGAYYHKISETLQAAATVELDVLGFKAQQAAMFGLPTQLGGTTSIGFKQDFPTGSLRASLDSAGKISLVAEKLVLPNAKLTIASELDHAKNGAKIGLNLQIEDQTKDVRDKFATLSAADRDAARAIMADPPS